MRITKFTHACVRLEDGDRVLVIDPGIWSEPGALLGATAVLVTHEHADHIDPLRLAGLGVPVYAPEGADLGLLERGLAGRTGGGALHRVRAGAEFTAAGFPVRAFGGRHATIHGGMPDCANLGYLVDGRAYHPGDSLYRPDAPVETLFVPVHGNWLKTTEAIDFVNAVRPERAFPIHEAQLNERGLSAVTGWLAEETGGHGFRYLAPRETA